MFRFMNPILLAWPIVTQIFITMLLYLWLAVVKTREIKAGNVDRKRTALHADAWPESVIKINNNIRSQFEIPIVFYVTLIVVWLQGSPSLTVVILAWAFVATRLAHTTVHITSNTVKYRFRFFLLSMCVMFALLIAAASALIA